MREREGKSEVCTVEAATRRVSVWRNLVKRAAESGTRRRRHDGGREKRGKACTETRESEREKRQEKREREKPISKHTLPFTAHVRRMRERASAKVTESGSKTEDEDEAGVRGRKVEEEEGKKPLKRNLFLSLLLFCKSFKS